MAKSIPEVKIGNEVYQVKDRTAREHLVEVTETQPTSEDNKLWIKNQEAEYEVPTIDEHNQLKSAFKIITDNDYGLSVVPSASWTDNYYIDLSGSTVNIASPVSANTMRYIVCNCVPGEIFQINGQGGNDARLWAFADKNGNILLKENANTTRVDYLISAPTDSYYLISNFVKSYSPQSIKKVIEKKDSTLMSQYDEIEITDGWFSGGYYDVSGLTVDITTPVSASSMNAIVKECIEGEIFKVSGKGGNAGRLWAFADTGKNILTKELAGITTTNKQLIAPKNAAYIIVNTNNTTTPRGLWKYTEKAIIQSEKNEEDIDYLLDVTNELESVKEIPSGDIVFTARKLIQYATGNVQNVSSDNVVASDYVEIPDKSKKLTYIRRILTSAGQGGMAFYNSSKVYISGVPDDVGTAVGSETETVNIPSGAKYVRFTYTINVSGFPPFEASVTGSFRIDELEEQIQNEDIHNTNLTVKAIDFYSTGDTDDEAISLALSFLSGFTGEKTLVFDTRDWNISSAILLPSNITVIIDGVKIKQADNTFDNVFRVDNMTFDENYPNGLAVAYDEAENICIIGKNGASIEGPDTNRTYNHPSEGVVPMVGDFFGWRTHQISINGCKNVEICGLSFTKTRGWCICFDRCENLKVHDLYINSSGVKNGDGIDFRVGCSDIHVYNISGYTNDDTVACTAIYAEVTNADYPNGDIIYPGEPLRGFNAEFGAENCNISNAVINNITTTGKHHCVICLAQGGSQVHDILISNLIEKTASQRESMLKVYQGYGTGYQDGDLHDIRANNLVSLGADYVFQCNCKVSDVWINKLVQNNVSGSATDILYNDGITITNSGT